MKTLATTNWLANNLDNVRVLDATWHMPNTEKNALKEFKNGHIQGAIFFDLDKTSNQNSSFPHMLPKPNDWRKTISNLGIKNSDHVIIYDNSDVFSSCRIWYNFLYFGHEPDLVSVLDGGFKKWLIEEKKITTKLNSFAESSYLIKENFSMVLNKDQVNKNIINKSFELIDARSKERFQGLHQEPRKELRSGNIEGSKNIPFTKIINKEKNTFKKKDELKSIFDKLELDTSKSFAFTCGSGVTACVLGLANSIINDKRPVIYDGSWAEYGIK